MFQLLILIREKDPRDNKMEIEFKWTVTTV